MGQYLPGASPRRDNHFVCRVRRTPPLLRIICALDLRCGASKSCPCHDALSVDRLGSIGREPDIFGRALCCVPAARLRRFWAAGEPKPRKRLRRLICSAGASCRGNLGVGTRLSPGSCPEPRRRDASISCQLRCGRERCVFEDPWTVLHELAPPVEGSAGDHVERDVGVAVVDAF